MDGKPAPLGPLSIPAADSLEDLMNRGLSEDEAKLMLRQVAEEQDREFVDDQGNAAAPPVPVPPGQRVASASHTGGTARAA